MSSQPDTPAAPRHSYDSLFGDEPQAYDSPAGEAEPYLPPNAPEHRREAAAPEPAPAPVPARETKPARTVDTGRLYHSAGATAAASTGALPALREARTTAPAPPDPSVAVDAPATPDPTASPDAALADPDLAPEPADVVASPAPTRFEGVAPAPGGSGSAAESLPASDPVATDARGLTYLGVVVVVGAPTLLVGLAQAIISNRIGWLTGLVLLVTSIYAALSVRTSDRSAAIVVPPLAFLVTTLLAGQLTLAEGGSFLVREGFMIFRTLAENAPWVLGATAVCAAIVLLRKLRASRTG